MMVTAAWRGTRDRMISLWCGVIALIKNVHSPSWACDLLPVLGEGPAKMSLVKVPDKFSTTLQATVFHTRQLFVHCDYSCGDVSIWRNVNTLQDERVELTWGIERTTEDEKVSNVHGTALVKHCHVRTPVIVQKKQQPTAMRLSNRFKVPARIKRFAFQLHSLIWNRW